MIFFIILFSLIKFIFHSAHLFLEYFKNICAGWKCWSHDSWFLICKKIIQRYLYQNFMIFYSSFSVWFKEEIYFTVIWKIYTKKTHNTIYIELNTDEIKNKYKIKKIVCFDCDLTWGILHEEEPKKICKLLLLLFGCWLVGLLVKNTLRLRKPYKVMLTEIMRKRERKLKLC